MQSFACIRKIVSVQRIRVRYNVKFTVKKNAI